MEIRLDSLFFPEVRHEGPQTADAVVRFPRAVRRAVAGITGYSATFAGDDHELGRLQIQLETFIDSVDPQSVIVRGTYALRDWSGTFDDSYTGTVQFAVIGELIPVAPPGPGAARPDLIIVDLEVNQAIQHFRSQNHLDAANVFPDNSIRLVADKTTGIRVYIDYDRASGLPVISEVTGSLDVIAGDGTTMTLGPVTSIAPGRDVQTDRAIANHTLNFIIPETLCRGLATLRCRVFDVLDATQFSEDFEMQVLFEDLPALPVFAVGIDYTGPDTIAGSPTTPPVESDFVNTLALTDLLYPVPAVTITGYQTMAYDKPVKSNISNGCDKLGDLKDTLGDLRGDSTDVYYGLLNSGVDTGSVGGCGGSSAGAGVGRINRQGTAAHEIGHVLGRRHAPCDNVTRCNRPKNTDDDYPLYSGYDSDSIGEYGFDTRDGSILDPATAHDFMGYSSNDWVSPYTYKALISRIPNFVNGGSDAAASALQASPRTATYPTALGFGLRSPRFGERAEWMPRKEEHLFINLRIHRDRSVEFRPAFHFPALPTSVEPVKTPFVIEFLDERGGVLTADCLHDIGDPCGCCGALRIWPKRIVQSVSFDKYARKVVVYEEHEVIYEQEIPVAPEVQLRCSGGESEVDWDYLSFSWAAGYSEDLWYLLQWRDRDGTWRGVMPRTQHTQAVVPKRWFGYQPRVAVRVLATSGIATGIGLWEGDLHRAPPAPRERGPTIVLQGMDRTMKGSQSLRPTIRVAVVDRFGAGVPSPEIIWFKGKGGEIGRGRSLDLRRLPRGQQAITVVVLDTGAGGAVASWLVERDADGQFWLHRGTIPTAG